MNENVSKTLNEIQRLEESDTVHRAKSIKVWPLRSNLKDVSDLTGQSKSKSRHDTDLYNKSSNEPSCGICDVLYVVSVMCTAYCRLIMCIE